MKKMIRLCCLICSVLLLSSCSSQVPYSKLRMFMNQEQREAERAEQIVSCLRQRDPAALRSLFSEDVLNNTPGLDDEIRILFDFIQGDILTWDYEGSFAEHNSQYGEMTLFLLFKINVHTDQDDYLLYLLDYNTDTINPENEGLYRIEASKSEYSGEWAAEADRMHGGIDIYGE